MTSGNDPDYTPLVSTWDITPRIPIPSVQLFYPNKTPKVAFVVDLWKPMINIYFNFYSVPRANYARVWMDIVSCIFNVPKDPDYAPSVEFCAWAFGCMCRFVLEDRQIEEHIHPKSYR
jgi:hypothetical protein